MSEKSELAVKAFADGANCSQSVLLALLDADSPSTEDAMRVAACFGGGMGRGEMCGAVTGGLMALGLRHGPTRPEDQDGKKNSKEAAAKFIAAFIERFGSCQCREIIKTNGKRICKDAVAGAVEILESSEK